MTDYKTVIAFFDEYICHYKNLLSFENDKISLLATDKIELLNKSLANEQALCMKGESFEQRRLKMMKSQGIEGLTFSKIIDNAPDEYKRKLTDQFSDLSRYIVQVKKLNQQAMSVVNGKLSAIAKRAEAVQGETYDEHGEKNNAVPESGSSISRNI